MNSGFSIFLAEDDEDDALFFEEAICELLTDPVIVVLTDGEKLMEHLETNEVLPDLIFLDLNMPRKDGLECLKEIKSNASWKAIKTIILSTTSDPIQIKECYALGADVFVSKAASHHEYKMRLKHCLL